MIIFFLIFISSQTYAVGSEQLKSIIPDFQKNIENLLSHNNCKFGTRDPDPESENSYMNDSYITALMEVGNILDTARKSADKVLTATQSKRLDELDKTMTDWVVKLCAQLNKLLKTGTDFTLTKPGQFINCKISPTYFLTRGKSILRFPESCIIEK